MLIQGKIIRNIFIIDLNQMNGMQKGPSEFIYLNQQHPQQHPHHLNQQMAAQNQYLQQSRNNV